MQRNIQQLTKEQYDLLVIGGGINGAAVANLAAQKKLKVALIEKNEFASGTSSRSSKLLHGGLRYLEHFEFDLVAESLRERNLQHKRYPHLTRPLGFIIPVYKGDRRPLWMMRCGVWLYDKLSGRHLIRPHRRLSTQDIIRLCPGVKSDGLLGGVMYYDVQMDDKGICLANVEEAQDKGAHVADHLEVIQFLKENGRSVGVRVADRIDNQEIDIRARTIVCATGPWTNELMRREGLRDPARVRVTKGVHLVYDENFSEHAMLLPVRGDGRIVFVMPWKGNTLIGTTDTDYHGRPDDVDVEAPDVDYLLAAVRRVFPDKGLTPQQVTASFAGLRPLVSRAGPSRPSASPRPGAPSKVSRKHVIETSLSGVIYVMGGKYTTYWKIARDVLARKL